MTNEQLQDITDLTIPGLDALHDAGKIGDIDHKYLREKALAVRADNARLTAVNSDLANKMLDMEGRYRARVEKLEADNAALRKRVEEAREAITDLLNGKIPMPPSYRADSTVRFQQLPPIAVNIIDRLREIAEGR